MSITPSESAANPVFAAGAIPNQTNGMLPDFEEISSTSSDIIEEVEKNSLRQRATNVLDAAKEDYNDGNKVRTLASGVGMIALQGLDRARASIVFVPTIAVDVFKSTHSPTVAALAGGVSFASWCIAVGGATTEGLGQYPKAVNEFEKNFPKVVNFFEDALPGMDDSPLPEDMSRAKRIGNNILTRIKRGYTVSGIGSVAYVSTAAAKGKTRRATHKLNVNAGIDGGAAIGAVVYGAAETISQVAHTHPELAMRIQNDASNIKLWYGVAGAMVAQQYIANKIKARKAAKTESGEF